MPTVTVRHNFEASHRLPHLPGKCQSLHGHSWWAHITVHAPKLSDDSTVVEFGPFKAGLRSWIDTHLDHGSMLGPDDPLANVLPEYGCKVHTVPGWPTVENVAAMIAQVAAEILATLTSAPDATVSQVRVTETHVNEATWLG